MDADTYPLLSQWPTGCTRVVEGSDVWRLQTFGPAGMQEVTLDEQELAALLDTLPVERLEAAISRREAAQQALCPRESGA